MNIPLLTRVWLAWQCLRGVYTQATWNGDVTVITFTDRRAWQRVHGRGEKP
jgi:hypothetical protein